MMMGVKEIAGGGIDLVVSSAGSFVEVLKKKSLYIIDDQLVSGPSNQ